MNATQVNISDASKKKTVILTMGAILTCIATALAIIALCILAFSGSDTKCHSFHPLT